MTVDEFLAARLDEDEAAAKAAAERAGPNWTNAPPNWEGVREPIGAVVTEGHGQTVVYDEGYPTVPEAAHIARHDPARVLREVAFWRSVLAEYSSAGNPGAADRSPEYPLMNRQAEGESDGNVNTMPNA